MRFFQALQCKRDDLIAAVYLKLLLNETRHTRGCGPSVTMFPNCSRGLIETQRIVKIGIVDQHFVWKLFNNQTSSSGARELCHGVGPRWIKVMLREPYKQSRFAMSSFFTGREGHDITPRGRSLSLVTVLVSIPRNGFHRESPHHGQPADQPRACPACF